MGMKLNFELFFYVGLMVIALMINIIQAASARRFSFRQGMSFLQAGVYVFVMLYFIISEADASFRFWTTALFFLVAFGEVAEATLLFSQKGEVKAANGPRRARQSESKQNILDKMQDQKERIVSENPRLIEAFGVILALGLSIGIAFVSLLLITGYIFQ